MPNENYEREIDNQYNFELDLWNNTKTKELNRDLKTKSLMEKLNAKTKPN